ncbi:MAG: exodeoxyribonuclease VII large subunit [Candidatus Nanopelagicaceae bacterium]|nr:exodeoxyribonuclease VII large subunit [Candidatus Nanopelagicaceae bacterium]
MPDQSEQLEKPFTVRAISERIGAIVDGLSEVWIEGELSEINVRPGSPTIFMRLRDTSADMSISVRCFKNVFDSVAPLETNARVVIRSKPTWWTKNGSLSFNISEIRQVGVGELMARLEALKNLLASEGLFDLDRKRALPFLPNVVGLICGRNSDAGKDVVENAKRRWPSVKFEIREAAVANAAAVSEVSEALSELEANSDVDVIIITRGGGSFEDLLPFSDESLLRLVANCKTPIISAIGHEKDSPLLDLVADWRASTPTDAGKRVVPDMEEELANISNLQDRANRFLQNLMTFEASKIKGFMERQIMREPQTIVTTRVEIITGLIARSHRSMTSRIAIAAAEISGLRTQVRTLSPQATLDRGYSVVQKSDGSVLRKASEVKPGEKLRLRLAQGEVGAITE